MGYFVIIVFSTFMGSPPEFLPIAFKSSADCENYLTKEVTNEYFEYQLETNLDKKYLVNYINNKFIVCKKLEYPINQNKIMIIKK